MNENRKTHLIDIPIAGKGGATWYRLHEEREAICEALLKPFEFPSEAQHRQALLQDQLRRIDDALDRLMSGSYGVCSNCGHSIEDAALDVDPAWALCMACCSRELTARRVKRNENHLSNSESGSGLLIERLNSFDTILVHTQNSDYRILLLDPGIGRALVEGGHYLSEPSEAIVRGSVLPEASFAAGRLCVGGSLEIWIHQQVIHTSPVESFEVKKNVAEESPDSISVASHELVARRKQSG